jgi:diguanylate cyclase (GGDEF)-like protein/PAS domain S-box-containing protein
MPTLRDLALTPEPLHVSDTVNDALRIFENAPSLPLIAVVDGGGRPIGVIERDGLLSRLGAGPYGHALFAGRPVEQMMTRDPLTFEAGASVAQIAAKAQELVGAGDIRGVVLVDQGRYFGVCPAGEVLRHVITDRAEAAERSYNFALTVIDHSPSLVVIREAGSGRFRLLNKAGERALGITRDELVGHVVSEIGPPDMLVALTQADRLLALATPATSSDIPFRRPSDGADRLLRLSRIPMEIPDDVPLVLYIGEDVTEARHAHARIEQLAHYDSLTGLPNRTLFRERLDEALAVDDAGRLAVLAIDVDRFKTVNDTLGHAAGDVLLREVANRLRGVLRPGDLAARLGGDEFAVLVLGENADVAAAAIAGRLTELLARPFSLAGQSVHLGGSIGVAVYPDDAREAGVLFGHAEIALCRAQAEGRGNWRRFDPAMHTEAQRRRELERDLRNAMENRELEAWFQPILSLADRRITGFEALMRWRHPTRGMVSPTEFIALAEEVGLIVPLGEWMLVQACKMAADLPQEITIAVNISAVQFRTPGLVSAVVRALASNGVPAHRLEIEVTESVLMDDQPHVFHSLRQLRDLGVRIALDDFGTGFASLAYLQRFPFDKIKIDRSFTMGLPGKQSSVAIISAVTALAAQLGMITTAEGVETEEQLAMVARLGCTQGQGYLIGKASPRPQDLLSCPGVVALRRAS